MASIVNLNTNIAFKRGSTASNNAYTGPVGTISIDTETKEIRYHDGTTPGGFIVNQNAVTSAKLKTARNINGVAFDGSSDITVYDSTKLPLTGGSLTNYLTLHADPVNSMHPTTKQYVDNIAAGLGPKLSVTVATTANITLSGLQTIDGVAVTTGQRVLVKNQTTTATNGIYLAAAGSWTRTTDADTWNELISAFVFVEKGTTNADTGWVCIVDQGGTLGSTAITWTQYTGSGTLSAGTGISMSGNVVSLSPVGTATPTAFLKVAVDAYGRVISTTNVTVQDIFSFISDGSLTNNLLANTSVASLSGTNSGDETTASIRTKLGITTLSGSNTGDQTITLTGDVTGSGTGSFVTSLKASGVTAGTYTKVTVSSKGIVTSGAAMDSNDVKTALNDTVLDLGTL